MKLKVFGTGSKGNSYLLSDSDGNSLIIDAGVNLNTVKKMIGFDFSKVEACLISHEHEDHAKYADDLKRYTNVLGPCVKLGRIEINKFTVSIFNVCHDVPTFGFMIYSRVDNKRVLYITDAKYVPYNFDEIDYLIIECNYDEETILGNYGKLDNRYLDRTRETHMSLEGLVSMLQNHFKTMPAHVVLIHGSERNLNEEKAIERVSEVLCGSQVTLAKSGMDILL